MKIITNDAVYVQMNDITSLNQFVSTIPASIFLKVYGNDVTIIDDRNRYDFVKFEEKHEIEFFKKLDYILDFDLVKDLDEYQIKLFMKKLSLEICEIADKYNAMSVKERRNKQNMINDFKRLEYKVYSIKDFLEFKNGNINFELPDGVDCTKIIRKQEKGIRKILARFKLR